MDSVLLTTNKLDINVLYQSMVSEKTGAVSLFVGTTRDTFEGKKVIFKCNENVMLPMLFA
jgi:molybdopterin synthase catalytic subunit